MTSTLLIKIRVNGQEYSIPNSTRVQELLEQFKIDSRYLAIALNETFIPKQTYSDYLLKDGDCLEIIHPVQGG